ncbi:4'-phosphopantetheinyl transferase family protein [Salinicola halophilus]|uniref:4'-phosphopantetheinyl transferase family protein n=1 Tax=Salinicola halophilus TaxID=184065 RepID=UPI0013A6832A|nr:4'-phosphopantetheinyl transferase superfamily protein [Salinicola halophilus]
MTASPLPSLPLPPGCQPLDRDWPWRQSLASAQFSAMRFETSALAAIDSSTYRIELSERLLASADKRRAEYVAGRLCAQQALQGLTHETSAPGQTSAGPPAWPRGTVGSITHSRGLAAAAVASRDHVAGLGIDAEARIPAERARRLAPQILVEAERDWLATLDDTAASEFVTTAFSLKESLFKALFPLVERRFYFHDARLIDWQPAERTATLELLTTLSPHWPAGARLAGQVTEIDDHLLTLIAIPRQS